MQGGLILKPTGWAQRTFNLARMLQSGTRPQAITQQSKVLSPSGAVIAELKIRLPHAVHGTQGEQSVDARSSALQARAEWAPVCPRLCPETLT